MKRTLSILLALIMLFGILPLTAYAEEADVAEDAAQEDLAETSGSELEIKNDLQDNSIGTLYYYYGDRHQYPYLRLTVTGGSGNYHYKWFYCGDTAVTNGTRITAPDAPEAQVTEAGCYYCIVQDIETSKQVRSRTAKVNEGSPRQPLSLRLMGDKLVWHESQLELTAGMSSEDFVRALHADCQKNRHNAQLDYNISVL